MSDSIQIRAASPDDLHPLANLARATFTQAYEEDMGSVATQAHVATNLSNPSLRRMLLEDSFLVAELDEHLIGFVQVGSVNSEYAQHLQLFDAAANEVKRLYVLRAYQNRSIGSDLLQRGLQMIGEQSSVYVTTWETNLGAQRLYERSGFSKVGQIPEYAANGVLNGYEFVMKRSN